MDIGILDVQSFGEDFGFAVVIFYIVRTDVVKVELDEESDDCHWVNPDELSEEVIEEVVAMISGLK